MKIFIRCSTQSSLECRLISVERRPSDDKSSRHDLGNLGNVE